VGLAVSQIPKEFFMDYRAPIQGISLERYAELSADVSDFVGDQEKCAQIVASKGVRRDDWDAAVSGWTARMQDPSLMGSVATEYMQLYQAALGRKSAQSGKAVPQLSFEDYVSISAENAVFGLPNVLSKHGLSQSEWTQIAGHWNNTIPTNPNYHGYGMLVEQEANRLRNGGAPRPLSLGGGAAGGPPQGGHAPPAGGGGKALGGTMLMEASPFAGGGPPNQPAGPPPMGGPPGMMGGPPPMGGPPGMMGGPPNMGAPQGGPPNMAVPYDQINAAAQMNYNAANQVVNASVTQSSNMMKYIIIAVVVGIPVIFIGIGLVFVLVTYVISG
jgi:hypothetical protein